MTAFRNASLQQHNSYRYYYRYVSDTDYQLVEDSSLTSMAQNYANYLAANNLFQHSNAASKKIGENLAYYFNSPIPTCGGKFIYNT